ncbi:RNA polymerase sigma-H factor Sigma-30 [Fibrella aestuarina BUZ 2]|uniref:RNA polymerase sigma factor n=1 Tax=Fibrella aestuarina BUZ 2 TaxID=1166018 RepID=I0K5K0_9BACT|nr:RNA polymerase sigma factor [Fibrella aestuarina]CCG99403.1 RNA polymerase sigma-H factor Sigma-30 [Fibrella aestuarina BUZ 2]
MATYPAPDLITALVERCRNGDRRAQYDLYGRYAKAMYNVCLRIVVHQAEAEDVLQEAFLDAFTNLHRFRAESTFGAWLKQIVINRAIGHLRSRRLLLVSTEAVAEGDLDRPDHTDSLDEEAIEWDVERVRQCMTTLPEGYRVVLSLYLFEGYDHEEIGQILGIGESTSRSQYLRAKKKLIERMHEKR